MEVKKSSGIGFSGLLCVAFIVLKLCHVIDWSWCCAGIAMHIDVTKNLLRRRILTRKCTVDFYVAKWERTVFALMESERVRRHERLY